MSILEVFPHKRPVRLGDRLYPVGELRIRDLAKLQEYVEHVIPHPYAARRDHIKSLTGRDRQRAILLVQREAAEYPPTYPDELTVTLFTATIRGGTFFLMLVLGLDVSLALDIYENMNEHDWSVLNRALWGISDGEDFDRLLSGGDSSGTKPDWCKMVAEVQDQTKLTLDQIGDLTVSQFNVLRMGKGREKYTEDWTNLTDEEVSRRLKEQHEQLAGDEDGD